MPGPDQRLPRETVAQPAPVAAPAFTPPPEPRPRRTVPTQSARLTLAQELAELASPRAAVPTVVVTSPAFTPAVSDDDSTWYYVGAACAFIFLATVFIKGRK